MSNSLTPVTEVEVLPPGSIDVPPDLAVRLESAYLEAVSGMQKVIIFGLLCVEAKDMVPHGQFQKWIEANCPRISYRTARKFKQLTEAILESLDPKMARAGHFAVKPENLFKPNQRSFPKEVLEFRQAILEIIENKSQHQLEFEFGIRKPRKGQLVGKGGTNNPEGKNGWNGRKDPFQCQEAAFQFVFGTQSHTVIEDKSFLGTLRHLKNEAFYNHLPFVAKHRLAEMLKELASEVEKTYERGLNDAKAAQKKAAKKTSKRKK